MIHCYQCMNLICSRDSEVIEVSNEVIKHARYFLIVVRNLLTKISGYSCEAWKPIFWRLIQQRYTSKQQRAILTSMYLCTIQMLCRYTFTDLIIRTPFLNICENMSICATINKGNTWLFALALEAYNLKLKSAICMSKLVCSLRSCIIYSCK